MSVEWNPLDRRGNVTLSNDNEGRDHGGRPMNPEELQKLVDSMRDFDLANFDPWAVLEEAADEIERLAKDVEYWKMIANRAYIDPKPLKEQIQAAFEEAAQIADSFGDRHEEFEPGDAIRARAAERIGK